MQKQASDTVPMDEEGRPVGAHDSELDSVKQELAKWQERVPKLAAALKERTNEVERLKAGGSDAVEADTVSDAGVKVRDELITELEAKVKDLTAKHRDLQGELHARDLTGKDLEAEVASWKDKWHSVTQSLDTQSELATAKKQELAQIREASEQALADATAASERSLAELQIELDELTARNGNLNETIELANRQIESLGDNLSNLREQLRAKDARIGELSGSEQDVTLEMQALNARANDFEARALQAEQQVDTDKNEIGNLESEIKQKTDACTRLEQDNERLTRDQDDLLAQMQALKEAHESVLTQQADALSCEHQEMQQKEMQALEQRLVEEHAEDMEKASARLSELEAELVTKDNEWIERLAEKEREFEERLGSSESLRQVIQEKDTEIERLHGEQEQQTNELKRLEEVVCHAEEAITQREDERRRLSETLADAETRARQLETQLQERSEFAVTLEEEKQHLNAMLEGAKNEHKVVLEARHKAERHAGEHAEHITQLDGRLERQKELMQQLEVELVETREEYEAEAKQSRAQFAGKENELGGLREELTKRNGLFEEQAAEFEKRMNTLQQSLNKAKESKSKKQTKGAREPDHSTELEALHSQLADYIEELNQSETRVKELEALPGNENALELQRTITQLEATVRERTDELNQHRWREEMAANDSKGGDDSGKMLVILNQQLNEARADNDRLLKELKGLDRGARSASASPADDLTRMKGIGPKLAKQLSELGYTSFASIADLSLDDIENEEHPLYSHRTRINRDRWIAQAAKLAS
ncbi:MAG: hypothetical protein O7C67_14185 [Gammaproteobacteria bacterium]|nr:hypothetical protein [Gammaproteobacteria bacterium]